jgi:putative ABC transport system ATP-binding protein
MNKELMQMKPIVEAVRLGKNFQTDGTMVEALCDVNLRVDAGEFVAIMGPSGSGKSTLLHLLGAMDIPTHGEVSFDGRAVSRLREGERTRLRCRGIGFVFQTFNLLPILNALENVEIALRFARVSRHERRGRARALLEGVGLEKRLFHLPRHLSGGERQRVAIARALANRPPLLLADEPTGNLDSSTGSAVMAILHRLNEQGQTIVMVTHDAGLADRAGRIVRMKDGRIY